MLHAIELAAVLLCMAIGVAMVDVAPRPARRAAVSFVGWVLAFGFGIAALWSADIAAPLAQVSILLLALYIAHWGLSALVSWFRGPFLLEPPRTVDMAALAQRVSKLSEREAVKVTKRVLQKHEAYMVLAALGRLRADAAWNAEAFESAWHTECESALRRSGEIAEQFEGKSRSGRLNSRAAIYVAQALALFEEGSVVRAFGKVNGLRLASHGGRSQAGEALEKWATWGPMASAMGIAPSTSESGVLRRTALSFGAILWPAIGLKRAGFPGRATAFAFSYALMLICAVAAFWLDRGSWYIFLSVALLLHVMAAMALGDFILPGPAPTSGDVRKSP